MHTLDKPNHAFFDDFGRKPIGICLKRIRRRRGLGVNRSKSFVRAESIRKEPGDQILGVLVLEVYQVAGAVESKAVLSERTAQSADGGFFFEYCGFVFS